MQKTNRDWLPSYAHPQRFLPRIQETRVLFTREPYLFADFVGRALEFLKGREAAKTGFKFDPNQALPCHWKCSDESLFQVDLALFAYTGLNAFNKGLIGGFFNESSLGASVHHGRINLDFGGSHVGYIPGGNGGRFGLIYRPQVRGYSADCGHLVGTIRPFLEVYADSCENILISCPDGEDFLVSIPNEFLQPNWSAHSIKLMVDLETLTSGEVEYSDSLPHTHTPIARSLFHLATEFLDTLGEEEIQEIKENGPVPIGRRLRPHYFTIYDTAAEMGEEGLPARKQLLYMKYIVGAQHSPPALKAAIVSANLEHNRVTDAVRSEAFMPYSFVSFTGVFIDCFDQETNNYHNLFQPVGMAIKPAGQTEQVDFSPEEIHHHLDAVRPQKPKINLGPVLGLEAEERLRERYTFKPGLFQR